jgi:hypothetical protein
MSASPGGALQEFAQPLQAALLCVTPARLQLLSDAEGAVEMLRLASATGVRLRRFDSSDGLPLSAIYFRADHHISTMLTSTDGDTRRYQVILRGYRYGILDQHQREIIAFHWHPGRRSYEHDPHLHVGSVIVDPDASDFGKPFSRFHIPTGKMALARVVRMLITEFNVVPNRQDWEAVINRLLDVDDTG